MIIQTYYIGTGAKNVFYTLRRSREDTKAPYLAGCFDHYVCTLSTDEDKAAEKAREYVEAFRQRVGETDDFKILFDPYADQEVYKRRGKLSIRDTHAIEDIEEGILPFGKHRGTKIADAPDSYVLYWADKSKEDLEPVIGALSAACLGVALEKGLIAKRDEQRAARAAQDALSNFIGQVGDRLVFEGEVITSFYKDSEWGDGYWINKVRCGDDIVCYIGKQLAERGSTVRFKATVKKHDEYNGVKSTQVNRPKVLS